MISSLCTTGEIFPVEQIQRLAENGKRLACIRIHHVNINQWCSMLREVRTHRRSLTPEVTFVLIGIIESSTYVGKTLDEFVDYQVHITTYAETIGIIIFCGTEIDQVFKAIVVDIRIEVSTCTTTLDFQCGFRTVICLTNIIGGIVVHVRITIWINTQGMVVYLLLRIAGTCGQLVV